jgi:hypothetical protein
MEAAMSKPFTLSLERVHCDEAQRGEWGSDEMYLVGFGISKSGDRFTIRPLSLGSFDKGDTSGSGYPKTLVDIQVADSESLVSTCIWLFERDRGGLASAGNQLDAWFNTHMNDFLADNANLGLSTDARQYYAFAKSMDIMEYSLEIAASDTWNSDDLLQHIYYDHVPVRRPSAYQRRFFGFGAWYDLTFRYELGGPIIVPSD